MRELSIMSNLTGRTVCAIAYAASRLISLRRALVHHQLSFEECDEAGLDVGSLDPNPAVVVTRALGLSLWRIDVWRDHAGEPEICLNIDLLGWSAEVWYYGPGESMESARAFTRAAYQRRRAPIKA